MEKEPENYRFKPIVFGSFLTYIFSQCQNLAICKNSQIFVESFKSQKTLKNEPKRFTTACVSM